MPNLYKPATFCNDKMILSFCAFRSASASCCSVYIYRKTISRAFVHFRQPFNVFKVFFISVISTTTKTKRFEAQRNLPFLFPPKVTFTFLCKITRYSLTLRYCIEWWQIAWKYVENQLLQLKINNTHFKLKFFPIDLNCSMLYSNDSSGMIVSVFFLWTPCCLDFYTDVVCFVVVK